MTAPPPAGKCGKRIAWGVHRTGGAFTAGRVWPGSDRHNAVWPHTKFERRADRFGAVKIDSCVNTTSRLMVVLDATVAQAPKLT